MRVLAGPRANSFSGSISALSFSDARKDAPCRQRGFPIRVSTNRSAGRSGSEDRHLSGQVTLAVKCKTAECRYSTPKSNARFEGENRGSHHRQLSLGRKRRKLLLSGDDDVGKGSRITSPSSLYREYRASKGRVLPKPRSKNAEESIVRTSPTKCSAGMTVGTFVGGGRSRAAKASRDPGRESKPRDRGVTTGELLEMHQPTYSAWKCISKTIPTSPANPAWRGEGSTGSPGPAAGNRSCS